MNFHKKTTSGWIYSFDKSVYFIAFDYRSFVEHGSGKGIVGVVQKVQVDIHMYMIKRNSIEQGRTRLDRSINNLMSDRGDQNK